VVYDCSLFLQTALKRHGPAAACFDLLEAGRVQLVTSDAVLAEVREVLVRPKLLRKYPQLSSPWVAEFLESAFARALHFDEVPERFSYPRDPQDEPYLNLALAAGATYLVSRDKDLLDLQDPTSEPGQELRQHLLQLTILDPVTFLQRLNPASEDAL
jgi:putative PIN family toxin of toxin-antitoxin system